MTCTSRHGKVRETDFLVRRQPRTKLDGTRCSWAGLPCRPRLHILTAMPCGECRIHRGRCGMCGHCSTARTRAAKPTRAHQKRNCRPTQPAPQPSACRLTTRSLSLPPLPPARSLSLSPPSSTPKSHGLVSAHLAGAQPDHPVRAGHPDGGLRHHGRLRARPRGRRAELGVRPHGGRHVRVPAPGRPGRQAGAAHRLLLSAGPAVRPRVRCAGGAPADCRDRGVHRHGLDLKGCRRPAGSHGALDRRALGGVPLRPHPLRQRLVGRDGGQLCFDHAPFNHCFCRAGPVAGARARPAGPPGDPCGVPALSFSLLPLRLRRHRPAPGRHRLGGRFPGVRPALARPGRAQPGAGRRAAARRPARREAARPPRRRRPRRPARPAPGPGRGGHAGAYPRGAAGLAHARRVRLLRRRVRAGGKKRE